MAVPTSPREALIAYISSLSDDEAQDLLDWIALQHEPEELTPEEELMLAESEDDFARGDFLTREQVIAKYGG